MSQVHHATGQSIHPPFPAHLERAVFGMGCFWGAERLFWETPGVYTTAVGYAGGMSESPDYKLVCTGSTGHAEVVLVVFDPTQISYAELLTLFWENHDPTQGDRQGNDVGSQYRSLIFTHSPEQEQQAEASRRSFQRALDASRRGVITTELAPAPPFYYAEEKHQQYLSKNPDGYCGLKGTGVSCPIPPRPPSPR